MSPSLGFLVLLSVILMQATKNLSDAWLAHWVMNVNPSNNSYPNDTVLLETSAIHLHIDLNILAEEVKKLISFEKIQRYLLGESSLVAENSPTDPTEATSYYLIIYFFLG